MRRCWGDSSIDAAAPNGEGPSSTIPLEFLNNNIGRDGLDVEMDCLQQQYMEQGATGGDPDDKVGNHTNGDIIVLDKTKETLHFLWDKETHKAAFQAHYSKEMARQVQLLYSNADTTMISSPPKVSTDSED